MKLNDLSCFEKARENLKEVVRDTPLLYSSTFSKLTGNNIYFKCENKQKTGSFKLRGAYNKIAELNCDERRKGVIASSAGNHAQGVAYAATSFGVEATVVMPLTAPLAKIQATLGYGANVIKYGEVYDECFNKAMEIREKEGVTFVHPFNDEDVIAGQGTIAFEILDKLPEVDVILVPIGGGGLISGIATAAKMLKPEIIIIGVEAEIIPSTKVSLANKKITTLPGVKSLADGISVKTPGDITFEYIKKYVDRVVTVSEDEIAYAIFILMERMKLVSEGAGAVTLAALLANKIPMSNKNIVSLISGGNIDIAMVSKIIERQLVLLKRRISFTVEIKDKVGQLGCFITKLGTLGANIIKVRQEKTWEEKGLEYADVIFEIETESKEHSIYILEALKKEEYKLEIIS
ncbi:threonine ammonia-lyase [Clostridium grantii]|uniref:L-threonine dehydratase catabolic TdcB n=1 Tax=Clostridium grantii DSM 8605 TaxID=1121316 RepID=A0A1M5XQL9_9CLOT|nr:threonine ammonia-lyase [Clostridium grantii]SHI01543.1 L-threonine ammonia-lyase [Clostridium grantii DSM 8605]